MTHPCSPAARVGRRQFAAALAFGGPDVRTAYLGCLFHTGISAWQAPVAGAPPGHWNVDRTVIDGHHKRRHPWTCTADN